MSLYSKLYSWLISKTGQDSIDEDIDLLESEIIDSVVFIELVYNVELLSGKSIEFNDENIENLKKLSTLKAVFFDE